LIDLDDQLTNLGPVSGREPPQHVQLALFNVDLEQVDSIEALLRDEAGQRPQLSGDRLRTQPVVDHGAYFRRELLARQ